MTLSEAAVRLLLDLLDQPQPIISGSALADFYKTSGAELIAAGLLVPDGYEPVDNTGEHDDAPVELTTFDDSQALGYFNPLTGWVTVDAARLTRYRVDREVLTALLVEPQRGRSTRTASTSETDEIWDLGQLRVPRRSRRVPVLLVRCAADPAAWKRARKWLIDHPTGENRVVMCAAPADRRPDDPPYGNVMMSLQDAVASNGGFRLDPQIVAARLDLMAGTIQPTEPLAVLGDGREVRLYGAVFRFPRGDTQRRIICALHQHYLNGEREVATAVIASELGLPDKARIRDYFKHCSSPVMDRLLWEKDGLCGFCVKP